MERAERARREQRLQVLARRRRTTALLFLVFTLGAVVAAVGGLGFLWAPAVPAVLLSAYIVHLRVQERRRYEFTMDRRRAEAAARQLRESRGPRRRHPEDAPAEGAEPDPAPPVSPRRPGGARWSSRPTTPSGWTSSGNANAARPAVTAGSRSRSRCPRT
ncbi:hypothetical protein GCM10020254_50060 [Streptomyces goshikiensis]